MSTLYLYFIKQYKNIWQSLSLRIRIEILILLIIYFTFFTTRLIDVFNEQLRESTVSPLGLTHFLLHVSVFIISLSIPFIQLNLIPKQPGLSNFKIVPLNKLNAFWLVLFLHLKYQLIGIILIFPLYIALMVTSGILYSIYFLACIFLYLILLIFTTAKLSLNAKKKISIYIRYFSVVIFVFAIYSVLYFFSDYYNLFDIILLMLAGSYLLFKLNNKWIDWDIWFKIISNKNEKRDRKNKIFTYSGFQKFSFLNLSPLIAKELLNYLRNRKFIRLQIVNLLVYCILILSIYLTMLENFIQLGTALTLLYIWHHFSLQFNEKYIKADSEAFIKTLPIKYYQLWLAKFAGEISFVLFVLLMFAVMLLFAGIQIADIFQPLLIIFLFALIVLATIINFKIIFFDKPRFAGYAYHFFILFILVMSINYFLVGPIIAMALLTYFTFNSYREFAR